MSNKDGGFVYPSSHITERGTTAHEDTLGISRRDWLAGLAMQGTSQILHDVESITKRAYKMADAMIAEGEKR